MRERSIEASILQVRQVDILAVRTVFADEDCESGTPSFLGFNCIDDPDMAVVADLPILPAFQHIGHVTAPQ